MDLQKAKQIYLQEVETAGLLSKDEMNSLYAPGLFFFFKQKTAYEMLRSLVGSEMCIRDRHQGSNIENFLVVN